MQLTVKKEIEETVNLELPIFFKEPKSQKYLGIISESQVITFRLSKDYASYQNGETWLFKSEINEANNNWNKITEEDFIATFEDFLRLQSLQPVLIENEKIVYHNPDDLNGIL